MRSINLTDFRKRASGLLSEVERGETLIVLRHGRPIAEVSPPAAAASGREPSWKRPALRLAIKGSGLAAAILEERERENVS